jgi:iron complex transport system ATP-binding protein
MTLSGGEKQRVVIAAALAQLGPFESGGPVPSEPPGTRAEGILLLDEPTAALDLRYQIELASLLRDLQSRFPITIVVSTHDLNFAATVCRTLVLIQSGRVLAAGRVEDVLTPNNVRALYGVEADVSRHPRTGRLLVVPVGRTADGARP